VFETPPFQRAKLIRSRQQKDRGRGNLRGERLDPRKIGADQSEAKTLPARERSGVWARAPTESKFGDAVQLAEVTANIKQRAKRPDPATQTPRRLGAIWLTSTTLLGNDAGRVGRPASRELRGVFASSSRTSRG